MSYATTLRGITAQQAADSVMPTSEISGTAGFTQTVYNDIVQAAQNGNFTSFNPSGCSGISPSGAKIVNAAAGVGTAGASLGLVIAGVSGIATAGITTAISLLTGLFLSIYNHHAAAVAKEQQVVCASVPAASDSLTAIDQAVTSGTITPAQGIQALQSLEQAFSQNVQSIIKMSSGSCNAACVWVKQLEAIVAFKSAQYQDMETAATAAATGTTAAASSATPAPAAGTAAAAATPGATATMVFPTTVAQAETDLGTTFVGLPLWMWLAGAAAIFVVSEVL
jgi:hypothetical protein